MSLTNYGQVNIAQVFEVRSTVQSPENRHN